MRTRLSLEDVLDDNPQHRALLRLFEEDSSHLFSWSRQLLSAITEWSHAQKRVGEAASHLSTILGSYKNQGFLLDEIELDMPIVTQKLARTIEETAGWMEVVGQQLDNCVRYPIAKLCNELESLLGDTKGVHMASKDLLNEAEERFLRVGRKENVAKMKEANQNVFVSKINYHRIALSYCSRLNAVQHTRYTHLIEPMLSLIYAYKSFFNAGHDAMKQPDITEFLSNAQQQMQIIAKDSEVERDRASEILLSLNAIQQTESDMYMGEPVMTEDMVASGTQKQGYLRVKTKSGLFFNNWECMYVFTQGAALMWQKADDFGGTIMMDLSSGASAEEVVDVDRRFCFCVKNAEGEKKWLIQGRNTRDMREWIATINNIGGNAGVDQKERSSRSLTPQTSRSIPPIQHTEGTDVSPNEDPLPQPIQFDLLSIGKLPDGFDEKETGALHQFNVDYLGSIEVSEEDTSDEMVHTAMDTILKSRAVHDIDEKQSFKMLLCGPRLILKDSDNFLRAYFDFPDIILWIVSKEDENMFAMINKTTSESDVPSRFTYSIFRCVDSKAVNVCEAFSRAEALLKLETRMKTAGLEENKYESIAEKANLSPQLSG